MNISLLRARKLIFEIIMVSSASPALPMRLAFKPLPRLFHDHCNFSYWKMATFIWALWFKRIANPSGVICAN